jgi:hypothetical protein
MYVQLSRGNVFMQTVLCCIHRCATLVNRWISSDWASGLVSSRWTIRKKRTKYTAETALWSFQNSWLDRWNTTTEARNDSQIWHKCPSIKRLWSFPYEGWNYFGFPSEDETRGRLGNSNYSDYLLRAKTTAIQPATVPANLAFGWYEKYAYWLVFTERKKI